MGRARAADKGVNVRCPFYHWDDGFSRITCEGVMDNSSVSQSFSHRADMRMQIDVYCCGCYKNCEVFRMIMEAKYND